MKSLLTVTLYSNTDELSYRKLIASLMHNIVAVTQKTQGGFYVGISRW
ncbi:hypothetical protein PHOSAC3_120937 [Mesotoga infera]|nr:hypothetical protein PHOSAC3_120937 [Mesotoga infera]